MRKELFTYQAAGVESKGYLAYEKTEGKKLPAIVIAPAWMGQDDFAREKAEALAKLGYVGFAADIYGEGKTADTPEKATALMTPLFLDRALLQRKIQAAVQAAASLPFVDSTRIGAIGYCFGGLTVIELLRSGTDVRGVVSFHGTLATKMGDKAAKTVPIAHNIKGALLILHGYEDPLVSLDDILNMQQEMNQAQVDWEMDIYGHTVHAFTNPQQHDSKTGLAFNAKSNARAWQAMKNFFEEVFNK